MPVDRLKANLVATRGNIHVYDVIFTIRFFALTVALVTAAQCSEHNNGGPLSVVGYFTKHVTLDCHRNTTGAVRWSFIPPGGKKDRELPVPGRHSYSSSNYGRHSLHLEHLQPTDAGLYVCRSTSEPEPFEPAAAFVVVVSDEPRCDSSGVRSSGRDTNTAYYNVSCIITYSGMLNVTIWLIVANDNRTIIRRNYTSLPENSWWKVETIVPINSTCFQDIICSAEFYSSVTAPDYAKNRPSPISAACARPQSPDKHGAIDAISDCPTKIPDWSTTVGLPQPSLGALTSTTDASDKAKLATVIILGLLALVIFIAAVIVIIVLIERMLRMRRSARNQPEETESGNLLQRQEANIPTNEDEANLRNIDATSMSQKVTASSPGASDAVHTDDEAIQPAIQPSNSASTLPSATSYSLHTSPASPRRDVQDWSDTNMASDSEEDENDNEDNVKTIVNNLAGRQLAQAASAALNSNNQ